MTGEPNDSDYATLLAVACHSTAQAKHVIRTLLAADTFPAHRATLVDLYHHEDSVHQTLRPLIARNSSAGGENEHHQSLTEYLTCIRSLGWHDFMVTTANFERAALYRIHCLLHIAPQSVRQRLAALIVHQEIYADLAEHLARSTDPVRETQPCFRAVPLFLPPAKIPRRTTRATAQPSPGTWTPSRR